MTDENTRLPSDSVVDAAKTKLEGGMSWAHHEHLKRSGAYNQVVEILAAALAAQPRDDVRAMVLVNHLEKVVREMRQAKERRTAISVEVLEKIITALSQGDEQPDTQGVCCGSCDMDEPLSGARLETEENTLPILPDTDGLAERARNMSALLDCKCGRDECTFLAAKEVIEAQATALRTRTDRKAVLEEERAQFQVIAERDRAEDIVAKMYSAVTGKEPQWSNLFGFEDALLEVESALAEGAGK